MKPRVVFLLATGMLACALASNAAFARDGHSRGGHHHRHGARVGVFVGAPAFAFGYGYRPYYYPPAYYPYAPYYPAPVVVAPATPPVYIERPDEQAAAPAQGGDYWYYCPDSKTYYPYVGTCASPWQRVAPQVSPQS
jgi:hypothetical protein